MLVQITPNWPVFICAPVFIISLVAFARWLFLNLNVLSFELSCDNFWLVALFRIFINDALRFWFSWSDPWKSGSAPFSCQHGFWIVLCRSHLLWAYNIRVIVIWQCVPPVRILSFGQRYLLQRVLIRAHSRGYIFEFWYLNFSNFYLLEALLRLRHVLNHLFGLNASDSAVR